jgi:hypothetical protein
VTFFLISTFQWRIVTSKRKKEEQKLQVKLQFFRKRIDEIIFRKLEPNAIAYTLEFNPLSTFRLQKKEVCAWLELVTNTIS